MATRALMSFGNSEVVGEVIATTYHHWDGYPAGLGATLFDLLKHEVIGTPEETVNRLIRDEPIGWSTINGADWSLAPAWDERGNNTNAPQSYTARGETRDFRIDVYDDIGQEWLYLIDLQHHTLHIFKYRYQRAFQPAQYTLRASVDWTGDAPDWEAI